MLLPLLETLRENHGSARPKDIYDQVAKKLGLSSEERKRTIAYEDQQANLFERDIRWLKLTAVLRGEIAVEKRGIWSLTAAGHGKLINASPGILITIFETGLGKALWGRAETAIGTIADNSLDLVFSSPPYPNAEKDYLNGLTLDENSWVSWMLDLIQALDPKLAETGSVLLNIGETFKPGTPAKAEHLSRLRVRLADESKFQVLDTLYWHNTARLPSPFNWVGQRRIRLKPSVEPILWLGKNPDKAKADNRKILVPYTQKMRDHLSGDKPYSTPTGRRASGHHIGSRGFSTDNGGSISPNLFAMGASGGNQAYYDGVRADGLPAHPAIMPIKLAEKLIEFTTDPGDLVYDPLAGSLTTAAAAENLGRRWLTSEASLAYIAGGRHRFPHRNETLEQINLRT